ncbi:TetR/AcrR family transcriptional regulator [Rhodococcus sp. NPDC003322]
MTDGKRAHRSTLRAEQAARTRVTVLDAATRCFLRDGYAATTMKRIAAEAGVAPQTVFAHGGKSTLLLAAVDRVLAGDDERVAPRDRDVFLGVVTARSKSAKLAALRRVVETRPAAEAGLVREFRRAAGGDAAIAAAWADYEQRRYAGLHALVASFGPLLRDGLDVDGATDIAWSVFTSATGDMFVSGRGWSTAEYARWLADAVDRLLLR